jgi:hypothetical protein
VSVVLRWLVLLALPTVLVGCGSGSVSPPRTNIDPAKTLAIQPTPAGLDQSNDVESLDVAGFQATLAGVAKADVAASYKSLGFYDAAIRRWSGPRGARVIMVISRWPDHQKATNVGGGAVNVVLDAAGAEGWTPSEIGGTRGARRTDDPQVRILADAIADVSLIVRADGPVTDAAIIRAMQLAIKPVRTAAPR